MLNSFLRPLLAFLWLWLGCCTHQAVYAQPQAVNAILGDSSWMALHDGLPSAQATEKERISTHLQYVLQKLQTAEMPTDEDLASQRMQRLSALENYIRAAVYPSQHQDSTQRIPCFVDDHSRLCAVAYLIDASGNQSLVAKINSKFRYHLLEEMEDAELLAWQRQSGLSLRELAMIQPTYEYERISVMRPHEIFQDPETGLFGVKRNKDGKILTSARYTQIELYSNSQGYGKAKKDGRWAVINDRGRIKTDFIFDEIRTSINADPPVFIAQQGEQFYLLSHKGRRLGKEAYDEIHQDNNGLFRVRLGLYWGMMNAKADLIISVENEQIVCLDPQNFLAVRGGKCGLLNANGDVLIPFEYDRIERIKLGWRAQMGDVIHLFSKDGQKKEVLGLQEIYPYGNSYHDWEMLGKKAGKYGLVNGNLQWNIPPVYDTIIRFLDYHQVRLGDLWGYFNNSKELLLPVRYSYIEFTLNAFIVKENGKMGVLDLHGQPVIPVVQDSVYRAVRNLSGGLNMCFSVAEQDQWVLYNQQGVRISEKPYRSITQLWDKLLLLQDDSYYWVGYYYQDELHVYAAHPYESIEQKVAWNGTTVVQQNGKFGLIRLYAHQAIGPGAPLTEIIYDSLYRAPLANFYIAIQDSKSGLVNHQGKVVLPIAYDAVHPVAVKPPHSSLAYMVFSQGAEEIWVDHQGNTMQYDPSFQPLQKIIGENAQ